MVDFYTVVFLIPKTGDRLVIDGVEAEVEMKTQFEPAIVTSSQYGRAKKATKPLTRLDIILEMATPTPEQYAKMNKMLINEKLYLHFQDIHPNLISGYVKGITMDHRKTTIKFDGNTIDKTYHDYVVEVSNKLNKQQLILSPEPDPGFKKKVHFKKKKTIQDLKRKLTF
jgi:hypothetical protein